MSIELWLPIPDDPGYEISDKGRVRSIDRVIKTRNGIAKKLKGKVLKPYYRESDGYAMVSTNNQRNLYVHQLVLKAFVGPRPEGMDTMHINGDPKDNRLSNLKWGSRRENIYDVVRHGRHNSARKTHCPRGHALVDPNLQPAKVKLGGRGCLACSRGYGAVQLHPDRDLLTESNKYYEKIMNGAK